MSDNDVMMALDDAAQACWHIRHLLRLYEGLCPQACCCSICRARNIAHDMFERLEPIVRAASEGERR